MIQTLNNFFTANLMPGLAFGLGVAFFFFYIPRNDNLRKYQLARKAMGATYILYSAMLIFTNYSAGPRTETPLESLIIIFISSWQAFLFTYTLITLINGKFASRRRIAVEVLHISLAGAAAFLSYALLPPQLLSIATWTYTLYYVVLLVCYVRLFRKHYHSYKSRLDNYYSSEEQRLRWVAVAFYEATAVGVTTLLVSLYPSLTMSVVMMVAVFVFYTTFGIRFLSYPFLMSEVELAIVTPGSSEDEIDEQEDEPTTVPQGDQQALMQRIEELVVLQRLFKQPDVSVIDIATQLDERPVAISAAIKHCMGVNFKTYINQHRVLEAQRLMSEDTAGVLTVDAVASYAGFSGRTNFYRVFKKITGKSPSEFRQGPE